MAALLSGRPRSLAFGLYLVLGLLTAGWYAIRDPGSVCACLGNADPATYMWSLEWWPHALLHGLNPFTPHVVWAPTGDNLARHATIPSAAFLMWPVTALFGPIVAYNVLSIGSPVLAAFTAYLLCRRIAGRELPALIGGYLFGFGPYMFAQLVGHINLTLVFLVPVMVHLALRRAEREISARVYIVCLAVVMIVQMGFSTEVFTTTVVFGVLALVLARLLAPAPYRGRMEGLIAETIGAGWLAALVASPFIYYAVVKGGQPVELANISDAYALDALNPFFPTGATWLGHQTFMELTKTFEGNNIAEADGYLGVPLMLAFVIWACTSRRRFLVRMLALLTGASLLAALGSHLHVAGVQTIGLPYDWVRGLPVVRLLTPSRISMFTLLVVAIGVACWLAETPAISDTAGVLRGRGPGALRGPGGRALRRAAGRWLLVALAVVSVFPNIGSPVWGGTVENPAFFRTGQYRHYLKRGEMAVVLPWAQNGNSMLWQADTGFYFRMPEGYLGHFAPKQFENVKIIGEFGSSEPVNPTALRAFIAKYGIRDILVDIDQLADVTYVEQLRRMGFQGVLAGGVMVFATGQ